MKNRRIFFWVVQESRYKKLLLKMCHIAQRLEYTVGILCEKDYFASYYAENRNSGIFITDTMAKGEETAIVLFDDSLGYLAQFEGCPIAVLWTIGAIADSIAHMVKVAAREYRFQIYHFVFSEAVAGNLLELDKQLLVMSMEKFVYPCFDVEKCVFYMMHVICGQTFESLSNDEWNAAVKHFIEKNDYNRAYAALVARKTLWNRATTKERLLEIAVRFGLGEYEEAKKTADEILLDEPHNYEAYMFLTQIEMATGNRRETIEELCGKIIDYAKDSSDEKMALSFCRECLGGMDNLPDEDGFVCGEKKEINNFKKLADRRCVIFSVMSVYDKKLEKEEQGSRYEIPFQVGAFYTEKNISEYNDYENLEDEIAVLHPRMSELTAWYVLWKKIDAEYVGIYHYRRKLDITDEKLEELMNLKYDVIIREGEAWAFSIRTAHAVFHYAYDWNIMLGILKEKYPQYYEKSLVFFGQGWWHTECIAIYKKELYDKACEFVFSILFDFCRLSGMKRDTYQRRDAAFLGERLLALYVYLNDGQLKVYETGLRLLPTQKADGENKINDAQSLYMEMVNALETGKMAYLQDLVYKKYNVSTEWVLNVKIFVDIWLMERMLRPNTTYDMVYEARDIGWLCKWVGDLSALLARLFEKETEEVNEEFCRAVKNKNLNTCVIYGIMLNREKTFEGDKLKIKNFFRKNGFTEMEKEFHMLEEISDFRYYV